MAYNGLLNNLYTLIYADVTVRTKVNSFVYNNVTNYMIFKGTVLPEFVETSTTKNMLTIDTKTILMYNNSSYEKGLPVQQTEIYISCRAKKQSDAEATALAVFTACNNIKGNGYYFTCDILPTIGPVDKNDNYNTIVSVTGKGA